MKAGGNHGVYDVRIGSHVRGIEGQVSVLCVGRYGSIELGVPGPEVDGLGTDQDDGAAVLGQRVE